MEVELVSYPKNLIDIIYTACRTCYSGNIPQNLYNNSKEKDNETKLKLIHKVLDSGHFSTIEHINFTFAISGVSRALLAQLSRHRIISLSVQSQRYVEIKEDLENLIILKSCGTKIDKKRLLSKYFTLKDDNDLFINAYLDDLIAYLKLVREGYLVEDARNVLPNATKTNIVFTCNLRELIHICSLRLCKNAQLEIRNLFKLIKQEVISQENCEWLKKYLVSNCKNCTDFRGCKGENK